MIWNGILDYLDTRNGVLILDYKLCHDTTAHNARVLFGSLALFQSTILNHRVQILS
jgi:hypothetical protein